MASILRRDDPRRLVQAIDRNDLLTFASAIAFQTLTALIPLAATLLALLGALDATELWDDVARELRPKMSDEAFAVVDSAVTQILERRQAFWLTAGALLALWSLSGAVRAMMGALDRVYGPAEERSLRSTLWTSILIALAIAALLGGALFAVRVTPLLIEESGALAVVLAVARWAVAGALISAAVAITIHFGSKREQPLPWLSLGTGLVVVTWLALSALFGVYVTDVADYGSVFGSLATLFVLSLYLYLSSIAFVSGIQLDALVRDRVNGRPA